jgi:hypothetical protein
VWFLAAVVAALGVFAVPSASARFAKASATPASNTISYCLATGTVYIEWTREHRPPDYSTVIPEPNGCWYPIYDLHSVYDHSNFTNCYPTSQGYPYLTTDVLGDGSMYSYSDTNINHANESSTMEGSSCLNGASHLDVEFEAPAGGSCGSSAENWVNRNNGFSVGVYLRELYQGADSCQDSISCSWDSNHGCIINAGADVPADYVVGGNGPCTAAVSVCKSRMATDINNACQDSSGVPNIRIYGDYALNENNGGTDDAKFVAGWINSDINTYCYYLFTGAPSTAPRRP